MSQDSGFFFLRFFFTHAEIRAFSHSKIHIAKKAQCIFLYTVAKNFYRKKRCYAFCTDHSIKTTEVLHEDRRMNERESQKK